MPVNDYDLLARLNALKPSQVSFDASPKPHLVDVEVTRPQYTDDKLAERLKGLRAGNLGAGSDLSPSSGLSSADALTAKVRDGIASEPDLNRDWQQEHGNEQTLDELLAELGDDSDWNLDPDDPKHINTLIQEAKAALPKSGEAGEAGEAGEECCQANNHNLEADDHGEAQSQDQQDEAEADDYMKRVLAELKIEKRYGFQERDEKSEAEVHLKSTDGTGFVLPSTPSNLPQSTVVNALPSLSNDDRELEARFSKLGLDLPPTPNTAPSSKAQATAKAKSRFSLATYTDDDIESWCCICNEDGEIRCLGCDSDVYCQECWRDGHGSSPGQERDHKAVQFVRKGGGAAAAAAA